VRSFALAQGLGILLTAGAGGAAVGQKAEPTARAPASSQVAGLITGADDIKSPSSERLFEGSANRPFDACYHKACDTLGNVDFRMLGQMADADAVVAVRVAG
jgi:hypothetical protein